MYKVSDDKMIFCPYNRSHVVSKLRIQSHIVKCKKNHPNVELATCFYNYTHRLKPEDMLEHYELCSHKARIDSAREYEPHCIFSPNVSQNIPEKYIPFTKSFPDINVKPKVFYSSPEYSLSESPINKNCPTSDNSDSWSTSDDIELEAMNENVHEAWPNENIHETWPLDENDSNELKPLQLPKTVSKAFIYTKSGVQSANTSPLVEIGRGNNLLKYSPKSPQTCEDALSSLNNIKTVEPSRIKNSTIDLKSQSWSTSVSSSMLDATTLKSEDIIFDDDTYNEDESDIEYIFDGVTKCRNEKNIDLGNMPE